MRFLITLLFCVIFSSVSFSQETEAIDSLIVKPNVQAYLEHVPNDTTDGYFKFRDSVVAPIKGLRIKLTSKPAMGSVLEIFNPYEVPFTYKAFIYNFKKKKYVEAAVYPVQPKMGVREMWDFPIEQILIKQFKLEVEK
ncbi:MAG: hypothetical protein KA163_14215 [Bacteroidia bacterium]|nr:hypothetical protein [Bacteroidia bacterium]